jgi:hypothetical protein
MAPVTATMLAMSSRPISAGRPGCRCRVDSGGRLPVKFEVDVFQAGAGSGGQQVRDGGLGDVPAAVDDHDVVGGLGDLGEDVAGDHDRLAFGVQAAEQVMQPANAVRWA